MVELANLIEAIRCGDFARVKKLVEANPGFLSLSLYNGDTVLHKAAKDCPSFAARMVRFLLKKGADPRVENMGGYTPEESARNQLRITLSNKKKDKIQEMIEVFGENFSSVSG